MIHIERVWRCNLFLKGHYTYFFGRHFPVRVSLNGLLQTYYADRFYEVRIHCPDTYPAQPPDVRFVSKIVMSCVDKNGKVIMSKLPSMKNWNRNMGIEQVLQAIRMEMCSDANRRTRQPADGTTY